MSSQQNLLQEFLKSCLETKKEGTIYLGSKDEFLAAASKLPNLNRKVTTRVPTVSNRRCLDHGSTIKKINGNDTIKEYKHTVTLRDIYGATRCSFNPYKSRNETCLFLIEDQTACIPLETILTRKKCYETNSSTLNLEQAPPSVYVLPLTTEKVLDYISLWQKQRPTPPAWTVVLTDLE